MITAASTKSKKQNRRHVEIVHLPLGDIRPSPENDRLYRPIDPDDPAIRDLSQSIRERGVMEPLVVTLDNWLVSGHRRHAAATLARLESVPCRVEPIYREDDRDGFVRLLREYNRQREKTLSEKLREEIVSADPKESYQSMIEHRKERAVVEVAPLMIAQPRRRAKISKAKRPMLDAAIKALGERRSYWPISVRSVHYLMLNDPPLRHASKPHSRYHNHERCYKDLDNLLVRGRLEGHIPFGAIGDETRPMVVWNAFPEPGAFIRKEASSFCKGYWRDLMQSQPNHVEILVEKNTIEPLVRPVAMEYCIPYTSGRGYSSLPPRKEMAERFRKSGKEKLVLLIVSDFDPEGEDIAHSFSRSMRDEFGIADIHPIKVALTSEQRDQYDLPTDFEAKPSSSRYKAFVAKYGKAVSELESLEPAILQSLLREAIDRAIDRDAFNRELELEEQDAGFLEGVRKSVHAMLKDADLGI